MPYKCEKLHIKQEDDRRVKLTEEQREEIRQKYGKVSQRKLAAEYGVSRRLVCFIGDPEQHRKNLEAREARGGSKAYYNREKHTAAIREHRRHKQKLYLEGKLEDGK